MFSLHKQPQSIGEVLDKGIMLYLAGFKKILPLSCVASLLAILPNLLFPELRAPQEEAELTATPMVVAILMGLASLVVWVPIIYRYAAISEGRDVGIGAALLHGLRCFLPMILSMILYVLALLGGLILLVVPGLFLMFSLGFYMYAIALDSEGPLSALKRSHKLVWGNWWRTAVVLTVPFIIIMVLYLGVGAVFAIPLATGATTLEDVLLYTVLLEAVATALLYPILYAVGLVQYHDLKLRKEGLDLQAQIATLQATP